MTSQEDRIEDRRTAYGLAFEMNSRATSLIPSLLLLKDEVRLMGRTDPHKQAAASQLTKYKAHP